MACGTCISSQTHLISFDNSYISIASILFTTHPCFIISIGNFCRRIHRSCIHHRASPLSHDINIIICHRSLHLNLIHLMCIVIIHRILRLRPLHRANLFKPLLLHQLDPTVIRRPALLPHPLGRLPTSARLAPRHPLALAVSMQQSTTSPTSPPKPCNTPSTNISTPSTSRSLFQVWQD